MSKHTKYPVRKLAYFTEEMAKAIDDYRYANRIPSENEAIRRLLSIGLTAHPIFEQVRDTYADGQSMSFQQFHDAIVDAWFENVGELKSKD